MKKLTWCFLLCFYGSSELPKAVLWGFISGPPAALYYVNNKVGKLEVQFDPPLEESTSKTSVKFA